MTWTGFSAPTIWARPGGRAWHPDPDLAGPRRQVDGGGHERRRVTASRRAHQRGSGAAIAALDRWLLAGGILVLAAGVILIAAPARRAPR